MPYEEQAEPAPSAARSPHPFIFHRSPATIPRMPVFFFARLSFLCAHARLHARTAGCLTPRIFRVGASSHFLTYQVWNAKECVVIKRSMATGYAGLDNPVFYKVRYRVRPSYGSMHAARTLSVYYTSPFLHPSNIGIIRFDGFAHTAAPLPFTLR